MNSFAHLNPVSPFYAVFPQGRAPIQNFLLPDVGDFEGVGLLEFYWLDVEKCSDAQIDQIAYLVALQCGGTPIEVEQHMRAEGVLPMRAVHVSGVSTNSLAFL